MRTLLSLFLACNLSALAAPDVSDSNSVKLVTSNDGAIQDVLINYPSQAAAIKTAIANKLAAEADTDALKRLKDLQARNVALPAAVSKTVNDRIEAVRAAKETALLKVKDTDIARAKTAMDKLMADGVPITKATQDAVNAKVAPTPTPVPAASPKPSPNDGL